MTQIYAPTWGSYFVPVPNLRERSFTIDEAQEGWQFATQCPEGHMYPADDEEFWGVNLDGNVNIDS